MSGWSWDYIYTKIQWTANDLLHSKDPLRRALGEKLLPFADALHDIEWVDSSDYAHGDEVDAIKVALGDDWKERTLSQLLDEHAALLDKWQEVLEDKGE